MRIKTAMYGMDALAVVLSCLVAASGESVLVFIIGFVFGMVGGALTVLRVEEKEQERRRQLVQSRMCMVQKEPRL